MTETKKNSAHLNLGFRNGFEFRISCFEIFLSMLQRLVNHGLQTSLWNSTNNLVKNLSTFE